MANLPRVNIDEPRWDQTTYIGRAMYFLSTTNPLNILSSDAELAEAEIIVTKYRLGENLPPGYTIKKLYKAKELYDSAFHPETGEKMVLIGRMSAQVPMNMAITGCMMTFYKSTSAVIFWQWVNQSFNAIVNYTNRSSHSISNQQLGTSYILATGGALGTALTLNRLVKSAPPLVGRFVPFAAVAAANCINLPMMRIRELQQGVPVYDMNNNKLGDSKVAAAEGIALVILSRIGMAVPSMGFSPIIMNKLEAQGVFVRFPWSAAPIQTLLCGFFLTFATPLCCALFSQKKQINITRLEPSIQEAAKKSKPPIITAWYNKGL